MEMIAEASMRMADRPGLTTFAVTVFAVAVIGWLICRVIRWAQYMRDGGS